MHTITYPWGTNRRFNAYAAYFKKHFGSRVQKVSIDAGFTCPNRDGTVGTGGCTFCNNNAFNPSYCQHGLSIPEQIQKGINFHKNRYRTANKFLAYFQAYSNTYKPLDQLKNIYNTALEQEGIVGLVIGTRPDCVSPELLDYFALLSKKVYLIVEYGIESTNDQVLQSINRGHTFSQAQWALHETANRGIHTGGHFILGLPGESADDICSAISIINQLPLTTIKFHQLQIIKNTKMAAEYTLTPEKFQLYDINQYLQLLVQIVEKLNPAIMIERISGEAPPEHILANRWGVRADKVLQSFENQLLEKNTWQGRLYG